MSIFLDSFLLIYNLPVVASSPTTEEHINSFARHSKFKILSINTEFGFPKQIAKYTFRGFIFHHSLFAPGSYYLNSNFLNYIEKNIGLYKVAFFQDEYRYCKERFSFLNKYNISTVYTLFEKSEFEKTYFKYTSVKNLHTVLTGYVSEDLLVKVNKYYKKIEDRKYDITYRARTLDFFMGSGAQEKTNIAFKIQKFLDPSKWKIDIKVNEVDRFNGDEWYKFLANSKAVLGVEAGVSIVDVEDKVRLKCDEIIANNPKITFEEIYDLYLHSIDNNIFYRTSSPRIFEAAAFKCVQVLFEGKYSGIVEPMKHFIPLKKDFSNIKDVLNILKNDHITNQILKNAYNDLISSNYYSYSQFISFFDQNIEKELLNFESPFFQKGKSFKYDIFLFFDFTLIKIFQTIFSFLKVNFAKYHFPGRDKIKNMLGLNNKL